MAQDPMEAMTRAKEAAERGESWMTAKYRSQQQLGAGYWLDTYDADHPFTEFEHEVALRSWLMLPPIPDLPEEPCVCGETTPGQMHAMRCKVVRRAIAQRPPARAHRGVSRGGTQGGDGTGPVGDNTIDEEIGLCGHHGTNYNPL